MMQIEGITSQAVHAYVDDRGFATLTIDGSTPPMLAAAFAADIQTASTATLIYERLEKVANGLESESYFSGNSCTVNIYRDRVSIENDILDSGERFEMSIEQYRVILDTWATFLAIS